VDSSARSPFDLPPHSTSRYRSRAPGRCLAGRRPGRGGQGRVNTVDAMFRLRDRRPHQASRAAPTATSASAAPPPPRAVRLLSLGPPPQVLDRHGLRQHERCHAHPCGV